MSTIDWQQVRTLVGAQSRLDLRHPKTGKVRTSRVLLTVVSYLFSSIILALSLREHAGDTETVLFVGLSFAVVLSAFAIVGSYDDLMGRPKDHAWALTLPASEPTHYVARLLNIAAFALVMCVSTALPLMVLVGGASGLAKALAAGTLLIYGMLGVTFVVLAVIWLLTLALPYAVFKPVISGARALLVGALVLGYQWIATQPTLTTDAPWWPPQWLIHGLWAGDGLNASTLGIAAIGVALALLYGAFFYRHYFALLKKVADGEQAESGRRYAGVAPNVWERVFVRATETRAAFGFAVAALRGDRLVRGRTWPAALLAFVFAAFGWWMGGLGDMFFYGAANVLMEPAIQMHLSVLVILLFSSQTMMQAIQFSENDEAAWVFDSLPLRSGRPLQLGVQQAILFRVLLPLHAALALLLAIEMPPAHALLHAGYWFVACAIVTRAQAIARSKPPFSRRSDRFSMSERFIPLVLAVPVALAFLLLQVIAFVHPLGAVTMIGGLGLFHVALGHLPSLRPIPPLPAWEPAPRPAEA